MLEGVYLNGFILTTLLLELWVKVGNVNKNDLYLFCKKLRFTLIKVLKERSRNNLSPK